MSQEDACAYGGVNGGIIVVVKSVVKYIFTNVFGSIVGGVAFVTHIGGYVCGSAVYAFY
jgi:riboflavin transporter FmnP